MSADLFRMIWLTQLPSWAIHLAPQAVMHLMKMLNRYILLKPIDLYNMRLDLLRAFSLAAMCKTWGVFKTTMYLLRQHLHRFWVHLFQEATHLTLS